MSNLVEEISRRRTFAIISHPDAGKTTLTEKFLLYGGAIAQAGVEQEFFGEGCFTGVRVGDDGKGSAPADFFY